MIKKKKKKKKPFPGGLNPLYVNGLQGSVLYTNEAHNGVGWKRVPIQTAVDSVCWVASSVFWTPSSGTSEVGCDVQYDSSSTYWYLNAFSGLHGSDSWCTARCLNWFNK